MVKGPDAEEAGLGGLVDTAEVVLPAVVDRVTIFVGELGLIARITPSKER